MSDHHRISGDLNPIRSIAGFMSLPVFSKRPTDPDTPEITGPDSERRPVPPLPPDIPTITVAWRVPPLAARKKVRQDFNNYARREFIVWLAITQTDVLASAGIGPAEIAAMKKNGNVPSGYEVHHKLPIAGGGDNNPSNLILIRVDVHDSIHAALDPQVAGLKEGQRREVRLPRPEGVFYGKPPAGPAIDETPPLAATKPGLLSRFLPGYDRPKPPSPSRFP